MPPRRNAKYKLPVPLPEGKVLDDMEGKQWVLGKMVCSGGFGLIYLAFPTNAPDRDARHVIKVEYQENGPLFSELKFYQRAAKKEYIKKWIELKQLDYLGIPLYYGSGLTEFKGRSYRFMVIERLGIDLQKISDQNGTFEKSTVLQLGLRLLNILEYIHENEYVHGDIKAANLLLGYKNPDRVYLADYGLAYRYCPNGNHKVYQENPKKGHNGTIEFTSLDAHKGVSLSRRSDLEVLGYCLLRWLCGALPWERDLQDPLAVQAAKTNLLDELPDSVLRWAPGSSCGEIAQYLMCAHNLAHDEKPDYQMLKQILNPRGVPLGPLDFSIKGERVNVRTPDERKVDAQKAGTKQVSQMPNSLGARNVHGERRAAPHAPRKTERNEKAPLGLRDKEAVQESTRRRQKYCELKEFLNEVKSSPRKDSCMYFSNSFYEPHQDFKSPDLSSKSRCPPWYTGTSVTGSEKSRGVRRAMSQSARSEETKADVYYYGFTVLFLFMLVCLALYFL